MAKPDKLQSRHWFGKMCAGVLLGFGLSLALSGLFAWFGPGGIDGGGGKAQFNMWLVALLWAPCWRALKTDPGCALNFDPPGVRG
ncbi:TPA: hypothetical protein UOA08_001379 [Stenotrophomonas maltophilia]|nr:hypothetical protein [Stenotrophomonas maltophilia]